MNTIKLKKLAGLALCAALIAPLAAQADQDDSNGNQQGYYNMMGGGYGGQQGYGMMGGGFGGGYGPGMGGGYGRGQGFGPGMMGGGGFGPGMMWNAFNRPVSENWGGAVWNYQQVSQFLADSAHQGKADVAKKTVRFDGNTIDINMTAVQPGHDDGTFEVHNITNPTIIVKEGTLVHLNLVNMDYGNNMEHGVIISQVAPPYNYMVMMQTGPGVASVMPLIPWRSQSDVKSAQYGELTGTFIAKVPGTYWYICPTPGHAQKGMYGKFVIEPK